MPADQEKQSEGEFGASSDDPEREEKQSAAGPQLLGASDGALEIRVRAPGYGRRGMGTFVRAACASGRVGRRDRFERTSESGDRELVPVASAHAAGARFCRWSSMTFTFGVRCRPLG